MVKTKQETDFKKDVFVRKMRKKTEQNETNSWSLCIKP